MKKNNFPKRGQSLIGIIIVLVIAGLITGGLYYYFSKQISKIPEIPEKPVEEIKPKEKAVTPPEEKVEEKPALPQPSKISIEKVQSTLISLIENLEETLKMVERGEISSALNSLENYEKKFNDFVIEIQQLNVEKQDRTKLVNLRLNEWKNYKYFLELKKSLESYPQVSQKIGEIENLIESQLKKETIKAVGVLVISPPKSPSYFYQKSFSKLFESFLKQITNINTLQAATPKRVIHKKAIKDPIDPGESLRDLICWSYESWIDLETGDIRQEQELPRARGINEPPYCGKEIDITDGATGKKLALDPINKLAEWIDPAKGKIGIGIEEKVDPYTLFKKTLEEGKCYFDGTDIFESKEIYILKCPIYGKDYKLFYIDARTFLPLKEMVYYEKILTEPEIIHTGEMFLNAAYRYVIGEIIERESLPPDFFELKIPPDYKLQEWVPYG